MLSLYNASSNAYILQPYMRIAQIIFERLDDIPPDELLYFNEKTPVYQNETGLNGSKIYLDFVGKVVRHFKGNYYYIENICIDSETKEYMVIYKTLYNRKDSNIWTRPMKMFFEEIDINRKDNITKQKHRFEIVDELTLDYTQNNKL